MKSFLSLIAFLLFCVSSMGQENINSLREKLLLDKGWKFFKGDIPFPIAKGHRESYNNAKAGNALGAASPNFNDNTWQITVEYALMPYCDTLSEVIIAMHK